MPHRFRRATRRANLLGMAAAGLALLAGCGTFPIENDVPASCVPSFPDAAGWYGGDIASSIPLSDPPSLRSLWLFGDSFVERRARPGARSYPYVHNTIGLSTCDRAGRFRLDTFWRGRELDRPRAFFAPDPDAEWVARARSESGLSPYYWPLAGFVSDGVLYVGLLRVATSPPRGPFRLPFRPVGTDLARVENPEDPPQDWRVELLALSDDPTLLPATTFVVEGEHVYAFAYFDRDDGRAPRALLRLPLAALRSGGPGLAQSWETLARGGRWQPGIDPEAAAIVMEDDATEMSVHFDATRERWIAVYAPPRPPAEGPSALQVRMARALEGPWSAPRRLHDIPETLPGAEGDIDPNVFCYAGKAHPQFSRGAQLLVTYVCNLFARSPDEALGVLHRLAESPALYRARAVRVSLPADASSGGSDSTGASDASDSAAATAASVSTD